MSLYYQDEQVTLYHGDSLAVMPTLDLKADVLLTDPPYFKVKQDEWDNQWDKASEFLAWMGDFLDASKPLLEPHASVWVFASPAMTSSVERLVSERFRVLNSIRWVKEAGWHQKAELAAMRRYLTPWEGIVFAEQETQIPSPFAQYIRTERERAGWTLKEVATLFPSRTGGITGCSHNWESGENLPTKEQYDLMARSFGPGFLKMSYEYLKDEYHRSRRAFHVRDRATSTDVWTFNPAAPSVAKHPCEKPQSMLRHMIETSSRPNDTILDPFAGSGSTLIAASHTGRRAVGVEKDERWCEHAANRLSQGALDIFGATA